MNIFSIFCIQKEVFFYIFVCHSFNHWLSEFLHYSFKSQDREKKKYQMGLRDRRGHPETLTAKQAAPGEPGYEESKSDDTSNMALRWVIGFACVGATILVIGGFVGLIIFLTMYSLSSFHSLFLPSLSH